MAIGSPHPHAPVIERVSTVEAVVNAITRMAYSGQLRAGEPLRENELAELFSVGRHSVRAALQVVARDGIAVYEPNRGVFVREFSLQDVEDIYALRLAIETEAVRAIRRRRAAPRDEVDAALARLARLAGDGDLGEAVLADLEVHRALVATAGSERMLAAFDSVMRELRLALVQAQVEFQDPAAMHREHQQLVDDLWRLSPAKAEQRIRANVEGSMADVKAAMQDG
ncbi:MAG: GntR family transcriptional regulator [Conexibacter sp.]